MLFIDDKPNMKRQYEFDFAKALAIFAMVMIHVYENFADVDYWGPATDWFDYILQFVSGPLAAPVFMIAMGVGIVYSKHRSPGELARRGLHLFLLSYVLGFFRYGLLYWILSPNGGWFSWDYLFMLIFNVDILQFAGLSFLFTALLKKCKVPVPAMGSIAVIMQVIGHFLARLKIEGIVGQCFLGLFFYTSDNSCFPFLLWYIYPVIGIIFAKYLRHTGDTDRLYKDVFFLSITVLVGLCFALKSFGYNISNFYILEEDIYYKQNFLSTLFAVSIVVLEMSIFHFLRKFIHSQHILNAVQYLSTNLNTIYIFQWLIIGNVTVIVYNYDLKFIPKKMVVPVGLVIALASIGLTELWHRFRAHFKLTKD